MKIPKNSALLVIDLQDGEAEDGMNDGIPVMQGSHTYENAPKIIKFFREHNLPVVQIRECHRADKSDFGRELDGSEHVHCLEKDSYFWEGAAPIEGEYTIPKRRYSAFFGTDLEILLRCKGMEHLFICGGMTDICVHFTAVEAHQLNYHIHVLREACHTHSPLDVAEAAFENMEYFQTGAVMSVDDLEW